MIRFRSAIECRFGRSLALVLSLAALPPGIALANSRRIPELSSTRANTELQHNVSLADYRARLQLLDKVVVGCRQAVSPADCKSEDVGLDLEVTLPSGPRVIRFGWLRNVLDIAANGQGKTPRLANATPTNGPKNGKVDRRLPGTNSGNVQANAFAPGNPAQLAEARRRLAQDQQWIPDARDPAAQKSQDAFAKPRSSLTEILAQREFRQISPAKTIKQRLMEKLLTWIDNFISKLVEAGSRSRWIGLTAEILLLVAIGAALVWFFVRLEKRGRFTLTSMRPDGMSEPASARDWQLWLKDARQAALEKEWRDAIHLIYWASISRLESSGLWPADRARTPREYLALLGHESAQRQDLVALTRSFEHTWYAGKPAIESDFQQAEAIAARLGAKPASRMAAQ